MTSLDNLGSALLIDGQVRQSRTALFRKHSESGRRFLGQNIPTRRKAVNNLGSLYCAMGKYAKAEPLCQEALWIRQKVLGKEHPKTSTSLNNLAVLYCEMGEYPKAEPLHQEALRICQKVLGPEHPDTMPSLNNLAGLLLGDG